MKAIAPTPRELQAKVSQMWTKRAQKGVFQVLRACNSSTDSVMIYLFRSCLVYLESFPTKPQTAVLLKCARAQPCASV